MAELGDKLPTYAELTQTQAWAGGAPMPISPHDYADSLDEPGASSSSRYTEGAVLGLGGMGKIMLARDARIGRDVAVKQLRRADRELSPEERSRFLREAQVQGQLEHPSIVPVYDIDHHPDGTTFFTMRRVLGRTLHAILEDLRAGDPSALARHTQRELLQAFATVCLAVDYAHSRGVIHRDLKPANIMLGDFGEVYVLDWGLARLLEPSHSAAGSSRLSSPGIAMGTPLYMAPEQMLDPNVDASADVFSLGAVLFEILTLQRLRAARDVNDIEAEIDARASVRAPDSQVALELELLCIRATQKDPADRFLSARALQEALARYLEGDRELEQRRELAASHAAAARAALDRAGRSDADHLRESGIAIRELGRALALEPTNTAHVAMFAEIMAAPPRSMPPEVAATIHTQTQGVIRTGAWFSAVAALSWFLFLPVVFALGLRRGDLAFAIAIPATTTSVLSFIALRQPSIGRGIQCATVLSTAVASIALSRMFGPLILMPTIVATWAIVMQTHADPFMRRFGFVSGTLTMVVPTTLELLGVLPTSYLFRDGMLVVLPQMNDMPEATTVGFLVTANLAAALIPALFVARLRSELTRATERELTQAWQFRRLPAELIRSK